MDSEKDKSVNKPTSHESPDKQKKEDELRIEPVEDRVNPTLDPGTGP